MTKQLPPPGRSAILNRLSEMRTEAGLCEVRRLNMACAKSAESYTGIFERALPHEKFRIVRFERHISGGDLVLFGQSLQDVVRAKLLARKAETAKVKGQTFKAADFDWSDLICPCCRAERGYTNCSRCGDLVCGARKRTTAFGETVFICHDNCGASFTTVPAVTVQGQGQDGSAAPRVGVDKAKSLPKPSQAALPPGTKLLK